MQSPTATSDVESGKKDRLLDHQRPYTSGEYPAPVLHQPNLFRLIAASVTGALLYHLVATTFPPLCSASEHVSSCAVKSEPDTVPILASPWTGSTEVHTLPPPSPTNTDWALFPSDVGFAGPTATGAEPAVLITAPAFPKQSGAPQLVVPSDIPQGGHHDADEDEDEKFDLLRTWGNLSPWFSNKKGAFGVHADPQPPEGCRVTGLHLVHRHGARYPAGEGS